MEASALKTTLAHLTREGSLYERMENGWVRCVACGHRCRIAPGRDGICRVRFNADGILRVPFGYVAGLAVDPIEKKPFFHVLPGRSALSFGMLGCDYHCGYCQNWITSQALRDPDAISPAQPVTPDEIVDLAMRHGAPVLTSTYNEPLITSEWAVEVFRRGRERGLMCSYVSNGNGTPEVLEYIRPYVSMYKIDLKSFRQKNYQQLGGKLETVLETIRNVYAMGIWVEIVTLVVPGFNDSDEELKEIARFLCSVSPFLPWHVTAFHQDYKMTDPDPTSVRTLLHAASLGRAEGLHYVYAGNLPGRMGLWENTYCHHCNELLVERHGFTVLRNLIKDSSCPRCGGMIPGLWTQGESSHM
jgi:pyruvate formate lyase activating enzyme